MNYDEETENILDDDTCKELWTHYGMFNNIKKHSLLVADVAEALAVRGLELGFPNYIKSCRAGGLLHDIAKSYTVQYGGNHSQLGAAWVIFSTENYRIAQIVLNHVEWRGELPSCLIHPLFMVLYADKRVKHNTIVTLEERYVDLLNRYGKTEQSRAAIYRGWEHIITIERILSAQLELSLHEYTFVGRRLVSRT